MESKDTAQSTTRDSEVYLEGIEARAQPSRPYITMRDAGAYLEVRVEGCRYSQEVLRYTEDAVNTFVKQWLEAHPRCALEVESIVMAQAKREQHRQWSYNELGVVQE